MRQIDFTNTQVASSGTARDINRGVVLNLIRRRQPISRASLARASGLQRSTVSLITEQLIRERWVVYGPTGRLPRGRRPTFLRLNDSRAIVVADIRPAQSTVAVADVNGRFLSQEDQEKSEKKSCTGIERQGFESDKGVLIKIRILRDGGIGCHFEYGRPARYPRAQKAEQRKSWTPRRNPNRPPDTPVS